MSDKVPKVKKHALSRDAVKRAGAKASLSAAGGLMGNMVAPGIGGPVGSGVGGFLGHLVDQIWKPISTQRAQTFGEMVAEGLQQLKDTDPRFDLDDYVSQEKITTTMLIALPAALRTTKAEKLSALRNAVLNAALPGSPDEDIIVFYLNAVDTLPASALKILEYFADPEDFGKRRGISYQADMTELDFFTRVFEEFNGQPELLDMLMRMLDERRFSGGAGNTASLGWLRMASDNMPSHPPQRRITPLGERFLAFIREPPNLNLPL